MRTGDARRVKLGSGSEALARRFIQAEAPSARRVPVRESQGKTDGAHGFPKGRAAGRGADPCEMVQAVALFRMRRPTPQDLVSKLDAGHICRGRACPCPLYEETNSIMDRQDEQDKEISNLKSQISTFFILPILSIHVDYSSPKTGRDKPCPYSRNGVLHF